MSETLDGRGAPGTPRHRTTRIRCSQPMRTKCPVHHVRLADGHDAWLVVGHDAARQALRDPRLSKDMLAALDEDPEVVDEGLPGPGVRPAHARRRPAGPHPAARPRRPSVRSEADRRARARLERIADELLDESLRAVRARSSIWSPASPVPLPFRVIGELLGVPLADQPALYTLFRTLFQPWSGSPPPAAVAASATIVAYPRAARRRHTASARRRPRRRARRRRAPTTSELTDRSSCRACSS